MKRTTLVLTLTVLVCLGWARVASGQCKFNNFTPLQHDTALYLGPTLLSILNAYPQLWTVLGAARDAWDGTNAGNRIGDWNGLQSASDCPVGLPVQLGAMDFSLGGCAAIGSGAAIAATDYEVSCSGCGTKSIIINTNVAWSFNPGPNEYDVQSALAHEFGHMLGFTHQHQNSCTELTTTTCAFDSNKNTMSRYLFKRGDVSTNPFDVGRRQC